MLADPSYARAKLEQIKAKTSWSVSYLEEKRAEHHASVQEFQGRIEKAIAMQEEKLRALSIEYDEELYPHLMSTIAERRYFHLLVFIITLSPCCLLTQNFFVNADG